MEWYFVGVDLGQSQDFTAIAILERKEEAGDWDPVMFAWKKKVSLQLRHAERLPLGTPYPEVAERVAQVTRSNLLAGRCHLAVDATGVGKPVVDLLRMAQPRCTMLPAVITAGERETLGNGVYSVPKRDLITHLQVLLQCRALKIAAGVKECATLLEEMRNMRVKISASGKEQYGPWREGRHDDLVLAVALACWAARKVYPRPALGEEQWHRSRYVWDTERLLRKVLG
mgnify:CR=1 FL=1